MGAVDIAEVVTGDMTAQEAYTALANRDRAEYGSDPYSGTFSTTRGVEELHIDPVSVDEAHSIAEGLFDKLDKWGNTKAIPLLGKESIAQEEVTFSFSVDGDTYSDEYINNIVSQHFGNQTVVGIKVDEVDLEWRVKAETTPGTSSTRYFINKISYRVPVIVGAVEGYASQSEARAAAMELMNTFGPNEQVTIRCVKVKSDQDADATADLLTIKRVVTSATITGKAIKLTTNGGPRRGWMIVGKAAE